MGVGSIRKRVQSGLAALMLATSVNAGAQEIAKSAPTQATQSPIFGLGGSVTGELEAYGKQKAPNVQSFSDLPFPTDQGNLEYFGFTGACPDAATIRETRPFMNLCTIELEDPRWNDRKWVSEMMANGTYAIVMAHNAFYRAVGPNGTAPFDLWPDYAQRWHEQTAGKEPQLAAIARYWYPADEPNWNGIDRSELLIAHNTIKASFPFGKTLASLNRMLTEPFFEGQEWVLDAIGLHRYGVDEPQNDPTYNFMRQLVNTYAADKERMYVMDAWIPHGSSTTQAQMVRRAQNYYAIAAADPDAKALIGFHWPRWPEGDGASTFSRATRQVYQRIGSAITGKCLAPVSVEAKNALFFQNCRFYATLDYSNGGPVAGRAYAHPVSDEFGQFTFFSDTNVELGLKIFHFPDPLGYYGVYISGYTNLNLDLRIYDSVSGEEVYGGYEYTGGTLTPPGEIGRIN